MRSVACLQYAPDVLNLAQQAPGDDGGKRVYVHARGNAGAGAYVFQTRHQAISSSGSDRARIDVPSERVFVCMCGAAKRWVYKINMAVATAHQIFGTKDVEVRHAPSRLCRCLKIEAYPSRRTPATHRSTPIPPSDMARVAQAQLEPKP